MAQPMPVPDTVAPAGAPSARGGGIVDKIKANPKAVLLILGGVIAVWWLFLRNRGSSTGDVTVTPDTPDVEGSNTWSNTGTTTNVDPSGTLASKTALQRPIAPYNMIVSVTGDGTAFLNSLKQFNITGKIVGTPATGTDTETQVALTVPTGQGQTWFSTLANDVRVTNMNINELYTSPDVVTGWNVLFNRTRTLLTTQPVGTAIPLTETAQAWVDELTTSLTSGSLTPKSAPESGYNLMVTVNQAGQSFINSLASFGITGKVISTKSDIADKMGTNVTGTPFSLVELKVPAGTWLTTLASDSRVEYITPGSTYTYSDLASGIAALKARLGL